MTAKNDITGDAIKSKPNTDAFEENFDRIFGKKDKTKKEDDWDERRIDIIGSNGPTGDHYDKV